MEPRPLVEQIASLGESVQVALAVFVKVIERKVELEDGQGLMRREAELEAAAKQFLAKVLEGEVQAALDSEAMEARRRELLRRWPKQLKARGVRPVRIRTLWGEVLVVQCVYWRGKRSGSIWTNSMFVRPKP